MNRFAQNRMHDSYCERSVSRHGEVPDQIIEGEEVLVPTFVDSSPPKRCHNGYEINMCTECGHQDLQMSGTHWFCNKCATSGEGMDCRPGPAIVPVWEPRGWIVSENIYSLQNDVSNLYWTSNDCNTTNQVTTIYMEVDCSQNNPHSDAPFGSNAKIEDTNIFEALMQAAASRPEEEADGMAMSEDEFDKRMKKKQADAMRKLFE